MKLLYALLASVVLWGSALAQTSTSQLPTGIQTSPNLIGICSTTSCTNNVWQGTTATTSTGGGTSGGSQPGYNSTTNTLSTDNLDAPTGRTATYVIAASDAPAHVKAQAGVVCDGTADDVEINAALVLGNTHLSEGTFTVASSIQVPSNTILSGEGQASTLIYAANGFTGEVIENTSTVATGSTFTNDTGTATGSPISLSIS